MIIEFDKQYNRIVRCWSLYDVFIVDDIDKFIEEGPKYRSWGHTGCLIWDNIMGPICHQVELSIKEKLRR